MRRAPRFRATPLSVPAYAITDLDTVFKGDDGPLTGYPTAVNDSGLIAYYDECNCISSSIFTIDSGAIVTDDQGDEYGPLLWQCCYNSASYSIPYAINNVGSVAGVWRYWIPTGTDFKGNITWSLYGKALYFDGQDNGSFALAINDNGVSVGQDVGPTGAFAGEWSLASNGRMHRVLLPGPQNRPWIGTATGINDAGQIVGYATFGNGTQGRAVRFFAGRPAEILRVAPAGVSTSAQAINVNGDIVGNAGSQAFLLKNGQVTYLPRPAGEEAGNAVAYAVNASDEVVGDIITSTGRTAFLYVNGASYDLNSLLPVNSGWQIESAVGINDSGQIVGQGDDANNSSGGSYSMKPVVPAAVLRR